MRLTAKQLQPAFDEIKHLGSRVRAKTYHDSVTVSCSTQFELAFSLGGPKQALDVLDRLMVYIRSDTPEKADLYKAALRLKATLEAGLSS
jgi:hypothetical protein